MSPNKAPCYPLARVLEEERPEDCLLVLRLPSPLVNRPGEVEEAEDLPCLAEAAVVEEEAA